jgi:predicted flavoprotein YhiN
LVNLLIKKVKENNCEIKVDSNVKEIKKINNIYEIKLDNKLKYKAKNIIISTGGKSFFQV